MTSAVYRPKLDIYVGEEKGFVARAHTKLDPELTIAAAHTHKCPACDRSWYCWCRLGGSDRACMGCFHEASLPKVRRKGERGDKVSKLFNDTEVSQGGWAARWVTTRELRAALSRWVMQEYRAAPKEVAEQGGAYQCGGCRFFLALGSDYGICSNKASRYDGRIVFEHVGCEANPWYVKNHPRR